MKKIWSVLAVAIALPAWSCDICGCNPGGYSLGLLPGATHHFIGIGYKWQNFHTTHLVLFEDEIPLHSEQSFQTLDVSGKYVLGKHLQLLGYIPWIKLVNAGDNERQMIQGVGDAMAVLFWSVPFAHDSTCSATDHKWLVGGSVKAPTGNHHLRSSEGTFYATPLQPGSGSWDVVVQSAYTVVHPRWGFTSEASYRFNTTNPEGFRFGHRFNGLAQLFLRKQVHNGSVTALPLVGIEIQRSGQDHEDEISNAYSGGYLVNAQVGTNITWKKSGIRAVASIPVAQEISQGQLTASTQVALAWFYLF